MVQHTVNAVASVAAAGAATTGHDEATDETYAYAVRVIAGIVAFYMAKNGRQFSRATRRLCR